MRRRHSVMLALSMPALAYAQARVDSVRPVSGCFGATPLPFCRDYIDLEVHFGNRVAVGPVWMQNLDSSRSVGVAALFTATNRMGQALAAEARLRRWTSTGLAVDLAAGPLWAIPGPANRSRLVPNGAAVGLTFMLEPFLGVFTRLQWLASRNKPAAVTGIVGIQSDFRGAIVALAAFGLWVLLIVLALSGAET